jgi:hypothetical protein
MLTQAQMAELFGYERLVITKHVRNVFREGELAEESNVQNLHILPPKGRLLRIHKGCIQPSAGMHTSVGQQRLLLELLINSYDYVSER